MRTIIATAMALVASVTNAAPVSLSCSGTAERRMLEPTRYPETMTITLDIAHNTLKLDDELLPIGIISDNIVTVDSPSFLGERLWIFLNQTTGALFVTTFNGQGQVAWEFEAVCKPRPKGMGE